MTQPVSRRRFAASLAAGAAAGSLPSAAPAGDPREPLVAPKPPAPKGLEAEAKLLFEVLLSRFPESRVAAKRAEITRQLWAGAYYGRVLERAGLTNADGPGPLWAAYRDETDDIGADG